MDQPMDHPPPTLLARVPVPRRRFTADEYHRMGEAGILGPGDRVELIEGELVQMSPIGSRHMGTVMLLHRALARAVGDAALVSVQNPVHLGDGSEPEPDVALLIPRADFYLTAIPQAAEVLLAVEVADTSLAYDQSVKAPLYSRHGIPEVWIVDLSARHVQVLRNPAGDAYASAATVGRDGALPVPGGTAIALRDILPDV